MSELPATVAGLLERATPALCAFSISSSYGVEIEYEAGSAYSYDSLVSCLDKSSLFTSPERTAKKKFEDNGSWAHMEDDSVTGGELVSPVFQGNLPYLELSQVCDAVTQCGGEVSSPAAGVHVHVGVSSLTDDAAWGRLFRVLTSLQDTLYKVAASPLRTSRGCHRSGNAAQPLSAIVEEGSVWETTLIAYMKKNLAITTFNVSKRDSGTIEFRLWDGTLDARLIAFYVALSCALVENASYDHMDTWTSMNPQELGDAIFPDAPELSSLFYALSQQCGYMAT